MVMPIPYTIVSRSFLTGILMLAMNITAGLVMAGVSTGAPEELSICLGGTPGIPPLLAQERGFFAAEGVAVKLRQFPTTTIGLEEFFKGGCDLSSISETAVVINSFERQDFSLLTTTATSDDSANILASRKSGIVTPNDLRGKRILVPQWSSNHFFLDMFLARHGMTEQDITLVVSGVPDPVAAFAAGTIDAYCATTAVIDKPRKALGGDAVVLDAPGLCLGSFHLVAHNRFIKSKPELVRKVLAAMLRNEEWMARDRPAAVKTAAALMDIDEQLMAEIWAKYRWKVELSQSLLISLEQEAQWAVDSGYTRHVGIPNYLDYVYQEALRSLKPQVVTILP